MARFHPATLEPSKAEMVATLTAAPRWGRPADAEVTVIGAYRFEDPDGRIGMEAHLVEAGGALLHVPLSYRDAPLDGADDGFVGEMHHSALGTRYVYDGLVDPIFVTMFAAVAMTGQGEALGMVHHDGRWIVAPTNVRIEGGGWTGGRVPVDEFRPVSDDQTSVRFRNDRFQLTVHRRPVARRRPKMGLAGTWDEKPDGVVLAEVAER